MPSPSQYNSAGRGRLRTLAPDSPVWFWVSWAPGQEGQVGIVTDGAGRVQQGIVSGNQQPRVGGAVGFVPGQPVGLIKVHHIEPIENAIGIIPRLGDVAVLYSILNGTVREFWVKTDDYDRKVAENSGVTLNVHFAGVATSDEGDEFNDPSSITGVCTATINFSAPIGTTVVPSSLSFSISAASAGGVLFGLKQTKSVVVTGGGIVTANCEVTNTFTNVDDDPEDIGGIESRLIVGFGLRGTGWGEGLRADNVFSPDASTSIATGIIEISKFLNSSIALLNGDYCLVRKNALFDARNFPVVPSEGGGVVNFLNTIDGITAGTGVLSFNESSSSDFSAVEEIVLAYETHGRFVAQINGATSIVLIASSSPNSYYIFSIINSNIVSGDIDGVDVDFVTIKVKPLATSSSTSTINTNQNLIPFWGNSAGGSISYGLHTEGSGLFPTYVSPEVIPVGIDDWRAPIVAYAPASIDSLDECLGLTIYNPEVILDNDNLYTIALSQNIDGETLRKKLESVSGSITSTLSTRTATVSGPSCALGAAVTSTVKVPSPGRGIIEGITYIP